MTAGAILDRLRHWRGREPHTVALIHDEKTITYRELVEMADRFVEWLSCENLPRRAIVSVEALKTPDTIALVAALDNLQHPVLLVSPNINAEARGEIYRTAAVAAGIVCTRNELSITSFDFGFAGPAHASKDQTPLFVLTTSGSTGTPKGVKLSASSVRNFFEWSQAYFDIGPGQTVLSYAPLNFDLSLLEVWAALDRGATVVLVDAEQAANGRVLRTLLQTHRPQLIQGVPLLFRLLLEDPLFSYPVITDLIVTGEATPKPLRQSIASAFPLARFHNIYGATETNDSFILSSDAEYFATSETLPIGQQIAATRYKILDEQGVVIEAAGIGELHTSTPFAALGYTDTKLTAQSFYAEGEHVYYRTGDMVERNAAGEIRLVGRRDHIVKVRGVRTNLREVEIALERHPDVKSAVVCPLHDDTGNLFLHAVVQLASASTISSLTLRHHCTATLPRSAIPSRFTVGSETLPQTSTGKPDRSAIKKTLEREKVPEHA